MAAETMHAAMRGIDCNTSLTPMTARAIYRHGYSFVIRYVGRLSQAASDLTAAEADVIRAAGLGLMIVQHVESERAWTPSESKGLLYGAMAARRCSTLGIAEGTSVWLDLEGVADGTPTEDVVHYCNAWYSAVRAEQFLPGLYVGWHSGLNADALYHRLSFTAYWAAYNLNTDQRPAVRGVQMHQRVAGIGDIPDGISFPIDVNIVSGDALGGFPVMDAA